MRHVAAVIGLLLAALPAAAQTAWTTSWPIKPGLELEKGSSGGWLITEETGTHYACALRTPVKPGDVIVTELPGLDCKRPYVLRATVLDEKGDITPIRTEATPKIRCTPRTGWDANGDGVVTATDFPAFRDAFTDGARSAKETAEVTHECVEVGH